MGSVPTAGSAGDEPPPGWAGATPYGAPWPFDPAQLAPAAGRPSPVRPAGRRTGAPPRPVDRPEQHRPEQHRPEQHRPGRQSGKAVPPAQHHQLPPRGRAPVTAGQPGTATPVRSAGRRFAAAAVVAVGAVAVAGAVLAVYGPAGPAGPARWAHKVSLPATADGYSRGSVGSRGALTSGDSFVSAAQTAVYQLNGPAGQARGLTAGSIGIDVGHIRGMSPGQAVSRIYGNFNGRVGRIAAGLTAPGQALPGQAAAGQAAAGQAAAGQSPAGRAAVSQFHAGQPLVGQPAAAQPAAGEAVVGAPQPVPAGPLGGQAICWQVTGPSVTGYGPSAGASCVWADADTFGFLLAPGLSTSRLASTLLMFRSAIETRSH